MRLIVNMESLPQTLYNTPQSKVFNLRNNTLKKVFKLLYKVFSEDMVLVKARSIQNLGESLGLGLIAVN